MLVFRRVDPDFVQELPKEKKGKGVLATNYKLRAFRETNYFGVQFVSEILRLDSLIVFQLKIGMSRTEDFPKSLEHPS